MPPFHARPVYTLQSSDLRFFSLQAKKGGKVGSGMGLAKQRIMKPDTNASQINFILYKLRFSYLLYLHILLIIQEFASG